MKSNQRLKNSKILLGITGGIAIYKAAELLRRLTVDYGAEVQVVMTASARKFITPLVFDTLSGRKVYTDMFAGEYVGTRHIDLAKFADLVVICPATANIIAKTVHGIGDDLLSSLLLASQQNTLFAPAMNVNMWNSPATQENLAKLKAYGHAVIEPAEGLLACNDQGKGKLAGIEEICEAIEKKLTGRSLLKDKKVVVTAGPTREKIDAVRYISNYSSGKMGLALALEAHNEGADVTLIAGPVNLQIPAGIKTLHVNTAAEMLTALLQSGENADYLFMAAAIEDFVPVKSFSRKIKKNNIPAAIEIQAAPDIVTEFRQRNSRTNIVGFSVEIEQGKENSLAKLNKKGLDYIVWNNPATEGAAFGHDTNEVTVFSKQNDEWFLPKDTKRNIAREIIKIISQNRV